RVSSAAPGGPVPVGGGMAPLAGGSAAPWDSAEALARSAAGEGQVAADPAHGRADAPVLGGKPRAAAEAPGGDLVPADRRHPAGGLHRQSAGATARGVAGGGAAARRELRGRGEEILRRSGGRVAWPIRCTPLSPPARPSTRWRAAMEIPRKARSYRSCP